MNGEINANLVPNYLTAQSFDLLRMAMIENNLRLKSFISYHTIQQLQNGSWIAWYYDNFNFDSLLQPKSKN